MSKPHQNYLFLLGSHPKLSLAELESVLYRSKLEIRNKLVDENYVLYNLPLFDPVKLMRQLGGTVKIYSILEADVDIDRLPGKLAENIRKLKLKRFFISSKDYNETKLKQFAQKAKSVLKAHGISTSFSILSKTQASAGISSKVPEITIVNNFMAISVAVQEIDWWSIKDYSRPASDPRSGMLPPKIARMMVNLALTDSLSENVTIFDPFCGSGTILMEALEMGLNVFGSDISQKAVDQTMENIRWYAKHAPLEEHCYNIFRSDVHQLTLASINHQPVEAIIFEGYLGPPNIELSQIDNIARGLVKLYIGAFKRLSNLLTKNGKLVCALPSYNHQADSRLTKLISRIEAFKLKLLMPPMDYARPNAVVRRKIYVLQKI